jgi:hypothetical protein
VLAASAASISIVRIDPSPIAAYLRGPPACGANGRIPVEPRLYGFGGPGSWRMVVPLGLVTVTSKPPLRVSRSG